MAVEKPCDERHSKVWLHTLLPYLVTFQNSWKKNVEGSQKPWFLSQESSIDDLKGYTQNENIEMERKNDPFISIYIMLVKQIAP